MYLNSLGTFQMSSFLIFWENVDITILSWRYYLPWWLSRNICLVFEVFLLNLVPIFLQAIWNVGVSQSSVLHLPSCHSIASSWDLINSLDHDYHKYDNAKKSDQSSELHLYKYELDTSTGKFQKHLKHNTLYFFLSCFLLKWDFLPVFPVQ